VARFDSCFLLACACRLRSERESTSELIRSHFAHETTRNLDAKILRFDRCARQFDFGGSGSASQ
jgi:hypothetical protein